MSKRAYVERYADMVALLVKAPRRLEEIVELTEFTPVACRRFLEALTSEGVLEQSREPAKRGQYRNVWRWNA